MIQFTSGLAPHFRRFVSLKQSGGVAFATQGQLLARFDRFIGRGGKVIRRDVMVTYLESLSSLFPRSRENAIGVVWSALAYAQRHGASVELPPRPPAPSGTLRKRRARIVTAEEFAALFAAAGRFGGNPDGLLPATTTTLLGLLYSTGLRIGEAHALDIGDLDVAAKTLTVRCGKFGKSRILPVRDSTVLALNRYIAHPLRRVSTENSMPLFITARRVRLVHGVAISNFRSVCRLAAISPPYPRVHDLRHSFAVSRLAAWYEQGRNVGALLPILSTYLGHVSIENTRAYLVSNGLLLDRAATLFAKKTSFLDEVAL